LSMTAFGILPRFTGVAIHDAYSGYDCFTTATHALCNAHYSEVRVCRQRGGWCWWRAVSGWPYRHNRGAMTLSI
jgi:transposase